MNLSGLEFMGVQNFEGVCIHYDNWEDLEESLHSTIPPPPSLSYLSIFILTSGWFTRGSSGCQTRAWYSITCLNTHDHIHPFSLSPSLTSSLWVIIAIVPVCGWWAILAGLSPRGTHLMCNFWISSIRPMIRVSPSERTRQSLKKEEGMKWIE